MPTEGLKRDFTLRSMTSFSRMWLKLQCGDIMYVIGIMRLPPRAQLASCITCLSCYRFVENVLLQRFGRRVRRTPAGNKVQGRVSSVISAKSHLSILFRRRSTVDDWTGVC
eukprot:897821-Prorocentrum_minimum.AAC.7